MSKLALLKAATDLTDVAHLLAIKPHALSFLLYKLPAAYKYHEFDIAKRYGGIRNISAPMGRLKSIQKNLSVLLQDCLQELEGAGLRKKGAAHGFKRKRTILTNAGEHRNRRYVFNADLKDFFPSINFGRVRGFFLADRHFALHPKVATAIAQIACYKNALPQGAPSSPVISNLIAHILDTHLVHLAERAGCHYTRYADDLTFSTNKPSFPTEVAERTAPTLSAWVPGKSLAAIVAKSGFAINPAKTRMQYCDSRQEVTGIVVNKKLNARSHYRRTLRAMTFRLITTGQFQFIYRSPSTVHTSLGRPLQLQGMLAFVDEIDIANKEDAIKQLDRPHDADIKFENTKLNRKETVYRRFLLFKDFFAAPRPVLLCEGPTDRIYIRCAVKSLHSHFPTLASTNAKGEVEPSFRRFKFEGKNTNRILRISGGADQLLGFIREYRDDSKRYKAPGPYEPVIILVDNDDGSKELFKYITEVRGIVAPRSEPFVHVCANVYVVPTPLDPKGGFTCIEDFFPPYLFKHLIEGKTFNPKKKHGDTKHYAKTIFADKVIAPQASTINFGAFMPLLANIELAINTHRKNHPKPP